MKLELYRRYTQQLTAALHARPGVLGLVALGSMAEQGELPDEYSDHDFFVVVEPWLAEELRGSSEWLPAPDRIRLRFRETPHGVKALYDDGHLIELAVFTLEELSLARVNRHRVLFDHADVEARMVRVERETRARIEAEAPSDEWLVGQMLTDALVGALRAARGETLAGSERVTQATRWFLRLVDRHRANERSDRRDSLDVLRRVEWVYPELGAELAAALLRPPPVRALLLLDLAERELAGPVPSFPTDALRVVRDRLRQQDRGTHAWTRSGKGPTE